jgi:hypothetical protein
MDFLRPKLRLGFSFSRFIVACGIWNKVAAHSLASYNPEASFLNNGEEKQEK